MTFLACFLSMNLVMLLCYNGKGLNKSGISKLDLYKGRVRRPRPVGSELGLFQNTKRAGPGKMDTQSRSEEW